MCRPGEVLSPVTRLSGVLSGLSTRDLSNSSDSESAGAELAVSCYSWRVELMLIFSSLWSEFPVSHAKCDMSRGEYLRGFLVPLDLPCFPIFDSILYHNYTPFFTHAAHHGSHLWYPPIHEPQWLHLAARTLWYL